MQPGGSGGVGSGELLDGDVRGDVPSDLRARPNAEVCRSVRERRHRTDAELEVVEAVGEDDLRIGRERVGVGGGDEEGVGRRRRVGHLAERPGPEGGPQAGLHESVAHAAPIRRARVLTPAVAVPLELRLRRRTPSLALAQLDDDRLEHPAGSAVDLHHPARPDGGVPHPRERGVLAEELAPAYVLPDLDTESGLESVEVVSEERDTTDLGSRADGLARRSLDRQVQPFARPVKPHSIRDLRRQSAR